MDSNNQAVAIPQESELNTIAKNAGLIVGALVIQTDDDFKFAGDELKELSNTYRKLEQQRKDITGPMDEAKKRVMELFRGPLETLDKHIKSGKAAMLTYQAEVDRKQAIARAAAEAEARRQREEAQAIALKQAQEAAAVAEAARKKQEEAEEAGRAALAAAQAGDDAAMEASFTEQHNAAVAADAARQEAAAVLADAQIALAQSTSLVAAPVHMAAPKVYGVSTSTTWDAQVTNRKAAVQHILANWNMYGNLISIDSVELRKLARAQKDAFKFPGVIATSKKGIRA